MFDTQTPSKYYWDTTEVDNLKLDLDNFYHRNVLPNIASFTISPTFAYSETYTSSSPNQNLTLNFTVTGATSLQIKYRTGIGTDNVVRLNVGDTSTTIVMPRQDVVFTLEATNADGVITAQAPFTYRVRSRILSFNVTGFRQEPGFGQRGSILINYSFTAHPAITTATLTSSDGHHHTSPLRASTRTGSVWTGSQRVSRGLTGQREAIRYTLAVGNAFDNTTQTITYTWPAQ